MSLDAMQAADASPGPRHKHLAYLLCILARSAQCIQ